MKKKIIGLFLSLTMFFNCSFNSFANPVALTVAPEVVGLILSTATACGVVLNTDWEKMLYVKTFIDSVCFPLGGVSEETEYKTFDNVIQLSDYIKENSKIQNNNDNNGDDKIQISPELLLYFKTVMDKIFNNKKPGGEIVSVGGYSDVPFYRDATSPRVELPSLNKGQKTVVSLGRGVTIEYANQYPGFGGSTSSKPYTWNVYYNGKKILESWLHASPPLVCFTYSTETDQLHFLENPRHEIGTLIQSDYSKYIFGFNGDYNSDNLNSSIDYNVNKLPTIDSNIKDELNIEYGESLDLEKAPSPDPSPEPSPDPSPEPSPEPDPSPDNGNGNEFPSFPNMGDKLDFSPLYVTNINDKFPFSLPWDFKRIIDVFDVEPVAPSFEVPLVTETIEIDFSYFEEWALIIRFFILIIFTSTLIFISTKLKG